MAKIIIGLAGQMASGKGTIATYVESRYSGVVYRFSTVLRDLLDRLYLEQSRENLQLLSTTLRQNFGEDVLDKVITKDVQKESSEVIVIDGVRRESDIIHLRELPDFKLVYIDTDIKKRFERITKRKENSDDEGKTFEEFQKEGNQESESQIKGLKKKSDFVINNNGTFEELYAQIDKIIEKCKD